MLSGIVLALLIYATSEQLLCLSIDAIVVL